MNIAKQIAAALSVDPCTPFRAFAVLTVMEGVDPVDGLRTLEHLAAMRRTRLDDREAALLARIDQPAR